LDDGVEEAVVAGKYGGNEMRMNFRQFWRVHYSTPS
jgi:hypothetical protein